MTKKFVFFALPDGSEGRILSKKEELREVLKWFKEEMYFYNRMYTEVESEYNVEKEIFQKSHHYYSDEEIHEACLQNRFAEIGMRISNEHYLEKWHRISGRWIVASRANDKYWKLYKVAAQIETVLKTM